MAPEVELDLHYGDALVTRARSTVATRFLRDSTASVLVTVDSDIVFNPPNLLQIAEQADELQAIVVGAYCTRSWSSGQVTAYLGEEPIRFANDPTPREIVWGASGFMAIPRVLFERMRDELDMPLMHASKGRDLQFYPFYECPRGKAPNGDDIPLSEDYDLCTKAASLGIKTYVNPAVRLGHLGTQSFRLEHIVWESEPPNVPMTLKKQGVWEAQFPPSRETDYVRMSRVTAEQLPDTSAIRLNRAERRRAERDRERVPA